MKRTGIIGAMEEEVAILKEKMEHVTVTRKADMEFYQGTLNGCEAVVVRSGIGKVNAGICVQILADVFQVDTIINTGVAGLWQVCVRSTSFLQNIERVNVPWSAVWRGSRCSMDTNRCHRAS